MLYQLQWLFGIAWYKKMILAREEVVPDYFKVLPWHSLGGLRKLMVNLSQNSQCPGQDSNQAPPKYKSEGLPLAPTCSVEEK